MEETKNITLFNWIEDKINKKEEVSIYDVKILLTTTLQKMTMKIY